MEVEEPNIEPKAPELPESSTLNSTLAKSVVFIDMGHLLAFDPRPIDLIELKKEPDSFLKDLTTQTAQLVVNNLFKLPVERVEDIVVAKLPKPITVIPREKPLPKEKPLTKWEQYAKLKGIQKKKKSKMVFDDASKEWKPRFGYKRANDSTKQWLIEIGDNEKDPYQDFFSKKTEERNERASKNELQRLRNIARATKKKVPGVGNTPTTDDKIKSEKLNVKKFNNLRNLANNPHCISR